MTTKRRAGYGGVAARTAGPRGAAALSGLRRADDDDEPAVRRALRSDEGWYAAAGRCEAFLRRLRGRRVLFLELGVGANTPAVIKFPFWRMTAANPDAVYACVNLDFACCPAGIAARSLCIRARTFRRCWRRWRKRLDKPARLRYTVAKTSFEEGTIG